MTRPLAISLADYIAAIVADYVCYSPHALLAWLQDEGTQNRP